jgi:Flp pilus assembly protein TadG
MMKRRGRGQGLVEFALVLPLFLFLVFGTIDLGRGVWAADAASHAASEAARFAIVHGGSIDTACHVGTGIVGTVSPTCPYPSPSKRMIVDVAKASAIAGGGNVNVDVCYGAGCSGNTDITGATNKRGTPVTVKVTIGVTIFTGALLGVKNFDVSSTATMVVNN